MTESLEEKLSNQNIYHGMEKVFEPSIRQQDKLLKQ